ncbi:hypothetical protein ACFQS3_07660 [Glycomyces mayteni]|uniref:Secreted protein n=1 Tax=Glycomyces mayteni TaxID=543887 RepID=A0ABW2D4N8_9ACTN|nr:hypothetical protein GCM10025732_24460 [Glycomyces mayteni]
MTAARHPTHRRLAVLAAVLLLLLAAADLCGLHRAEAHPATAATAAPTDCREHHQRHDETAAASAANLPNAYDTDAPDAAATGPRPGHGTERARPAAADPLLAPDTAALCVWRI